MLADAAHADRCHPRHRLPALRRASARGVVHPPSAVPGDLPRSVRPGPLRALQGDAVPAAGGDGAAGGRHRHRDRLLRLRRAAAELHRLRLHGAGCGHDLPGRPVPRRDVARPSLPGGGPLLLPSPEPAPVRAGEVRRDGCRAVRADGPAGHVAAGRRPARRALPRRPAPRLPARHGRRRGLCPGPRRHRPRGSGDDTAAWAGRCRRRGRAARSLRDPGDGPGPRRGARQRDLERLRRADLAVHPGRRRCQRTYSVRRPR